MTRHFPAVVVIFGMLGFALEPAHAQFYGPGAWCAVTNTGWGRYALGLPIPINCRMSPERARRQSWILQPKPEFCAQAAEAIVLQPVTAGCLCLPQQTCWRMLLWHG